MKRFPQFAWDLLESGIAQKSIVESCQNDGHIYRQNWSRRMEFPKIKYVFYYLVAFFYLPTITHLPIFNFFDGVVVGRK